MNQTKVFLVSYLVVMTLFAFSGGNALADENTASNTCAFEEYSVLAEVSSPAVITSEEIRVLSSNKVEKEHSPGFLQCNASVQKGNMHYQLEDDKLVLTMAGNDETVELSRIHQ